MIWSLNIDPLRQITETNHFSFFQFLAERSNPDHLGRITRFSIASAPHSSEFEDHGEHWFLHYIYYWQIIVEINTDVETEF